MVKENSLGFSSTPHKFLQKIPLKNQETHDQDQQQMLKCSENKPSSIVNPQWEEIRTQKLLKSRRILAGRLEKLSSKILSKS
jgi:hypothetical protein